MAGVSQGIRKLLLLYDAEGSPIGFIMNAGVYTYVKNLQGDIIKILDNLGNAVVSYCNNSPVSSFDPSGNFALAVAGTAVYLSAKTAIALLLAITTFAFLVSYQKQIQRAVSKVLYKLESFEREISIAVVAALSKGKTSKTAKHHIIARSDPRAGISKYYWTENCHLDINNPINLVRINRYFHLFIHTTAYHTAVCSMVLTGWHTNKKVGVVAAVVAIHAFLYAVNSKFF